MVVQSVKEQIITCTYVWAFKKYSSYTASNKIDTPTSNQIGFDFASTCDMSLVAIFQYTEELQYSDLLLTFAPTLLDEKVSSYVIRSYVVSSYAICSKIAEMIWGLIWFEVSEPKLLKTIFVAYSIVSDLPYEKKLYFY